MPSQPSFHDWEMAQKRGEGRPLLAVEVMRLFPGLLPDEIRQAVARAWEIRAGFIPVPRFPIRCPCCQSPRIQLSRIGYGQRPESPQRSRADVSFKCTRCSYFWTHGVPIPDEAYQRAMSAERPLGGKGPIWHWREIRQVLMPRED